MAGEKIAIVTVHGTGDTAEGPDGEKWFQRGAAFTESVRQKLAGEGLEADIVPFLWTGANSAWDRERGADALARVIKKTAKSYAGVHLVGHSHGGNVANEAAVHLRWGMKKRRREPIASMTTVGTPFLNMRTGWLQRAAGLMFLLVTWGSVIIFPLMLLGFAINKTPPLALLAYAALIGACLWFMLRIATRGARRIFRPSRKRQTAHSVLAILHENDEAISFLKRVEELPIEPFARGSLYRGSRAAAVSWGVLAVIAVGVLPFVLHATRIANVFNFSESEGVTMTAVMSAVIAPGVFVLVYGLYRFVVGGLTELSARKPLNNFVSGVLRGVALGRDGDQVICNVSEESHTHATELVKLEGECHARMLAGAGAAADKLIDKYRWSLFTVGADTNAPLASLATDTMTWDSLIHTTYFDQPEVADIVARHIAAKARGA